MTWKVVDTQNNSTMYFVRTRMRGRDECLTAPFGYFRPRLAQFFPSVSGGSTCAQTVLNGGVVLAWAAATIASILFLQTQFQWNGSIFFAFSDRSLSTVSQNGLLVTSTVFSF